MPHGTLLGFDYKLLEKHQNRAHVGKPNTEHASRMNTDPFTAEPTALSYYVDMKIPYAATLK